MTVRHWMSNLQHADTVAISPCAGREMELMDIGFKKYNDEAKRHPPNLGRLLGHVSFLNALQDHFDNLAELS